jgi:hypothetical protein
MAGGLGGTGYKAIQTSTKTPGQLDYYNKIMGGIGQGTDAALQGLTSQALGGNEDYWKQLEAPAKRQFQEQQGQIASRFSGMGSGGRNSSGHQNAQSGASVDFAERLGAQRLGLQKQAWEQLLGMGTHLFDQNLFETSIIPKKKKWWESGLEALSGGLGTLGGTFGGYGAGKKIFG